MNNEHLVDCVVRWAGGIERQDLDVLTSHHYRTFRRTHDKIVSLVWLKRGTRRLLKDYKDYSMNRRFQKLLKNKSLGGIQRLRKHKDILLDMVSVWLRYKQYDKEEKEEEEQQQNKEQESSNATLKIPAKTWKGELILDLDWSPKPGQEGL